MKVGVVVIFVNAHAALGRIELESGQTLDAELVISGDADCDVTLNGLLITGGTVVVSGNRIAVEVKELTPRLGDMR